MASCEESTGDSAQADGAHLAIARQRTCRTDRWYPSISRPGRPFSALMTLDRNTNIDQVYSQPRIPVPLKTLNQTRQSRQAEAKRIWPRGTGGTGDKDVVGPRMRIYRESLVTKYLDGFMSAKLTGAGEEINVLNRVNKAVGRD